MANLTSRIVVAENLSKRYGRTLALDNVSLSVERGQRYAILGPNGAGKTTLIHILCTIHKADSGFVQINGFDVARRPLKVREQLGVVFQETSLDTRLTVEENLRFHGRIFGVPERLIEKRMAELLELVELSQWAKQLVRTLSRGMQRRLELARALIHDSRLLILDEPTVGLDVQSRLNMWEYLGKLHAERDLSLLITTHYIEEVEGCDQVCILDHGKILTVGNPKRIKSQHGQTLVHMIPRDAASAAAITSKVVGAVLHEGTLSIPTESEDQVEKLLAAFGPLLRGFTVERPTLETAFLNLTGRTIRDQESGPRDRLLEFGRSGGEQTR